MLPVLSHFQARDILRAVEAGDKTVTTTLDLGLTPIELNLSPDTIQLPDGQKLSGEDLRIIAGSDLACYRIRGTEVERIETFSEAFNRYYSLMPTVRAPTMLISGIPGPKSVVGTKVAMIGM